MTTKIDVPPSHFDLLEAPLTAVLSGEGVIVTCTPIRVVTNG